MLKLLLLSKLTQSKLLRRLPVLQRALCAHVVIKVIGGSQLTDHCSDISEVSVLKRSLGRQKRESLEATELEGGGLST
jgi:hypothetical protein